MGAFACLGSYAGYELAEVLVLDSDVRVRLVACPGGMFRGLETAQRPQRHEIRPVPGSCCKQFHQEHHARSCSEHGERVGAQHGGGRGDLMRDTGHEARRSGVEPVRCRHVTLSDPR